MTDDRASRRRTGFWRAPILLAITLAVSTLGTASASAPDPRVKSSYRVQLLYAIPAGGVDRGRDQDGSILGSVESAQRWLQSQTGKRARFVSRDRVPVIKRIELERTESELATHDLYTSMQIEYEIRAQGFDRPGLIYGIYYEGAGPGCGYSATPPDVPGNSFTLFLGDPECMETPFAAAADPPGYLEFSLVHELLHTLGAVPNCAVHSNGSHHIDDPHELMHQGAWDWYPEYIDRDHDDYFGTGRDDCYDLAKSPYLTPTAPDAAPADPGTNPLPLESPCEEHPNAEWTSDQRILAVVNLTEGPIFLYWIDTNEAAQRYETLSRWEAVYISVYTGSAWMIRDLTGACLATFVMPDFAATAWVKATPD